MKHLINVLLNIRITLWLENINQRFWKSERKLEQKLGKNKLEKKRKVMLNVSLLIIQLNITSIK